MRILMLIWQYWPEPEGGTQRQCRRLVDVLARRGHECTVLTNWSRFSLARHEREQSVAIVRLGCLCPLYGALRAAVDCIRALLRYRPSGQVVTSELRTGPAEWFMRPVRWVAFLSFLVSVLLYVRKHRREIDVLHVHESTWIAGVAAWCGSKYHVPVICKEATFPTLPEIGKEVPFRCKLDSLRRKAFFVAYGNESRNDLVSKGVSVERVCVIPNGVDIPVEEATPGNSFVLYVGNATQGAKWKSFDVLISAWSRVSALRHDARLVVVGAGSWNEWHDLALKENCGDSIDFVGPVTDVSPYYRRTALLVLPSRVEGMSNVLLEAQSHGVPVVVSDIPGNTMVVRHERTGLVVPVGDVHALTRAIVRLLDDPGERAMLGRNGRRRMRDEFSMDSVVGSYEALYLRMTAKGETWS